MRVEVTEHRCHRVCCPDGRTITVAHSPAGVPVGQFGPHLRACLALLLGRFRLSRREVRELCRELFSLPVSLGGLVRIAHGVGEALGGSVRALARRVRRARVAHLDETGWWQESRRHWLWVVATAKDSLFRIAGRRGPEVVRALLGKTFRGIGISDRWSAYTELSRRGVCWAHLKRDFQAVADRGGPWGFLGKWGLDLIHRLFAHGHAFRRGEFSRPRLRRRLAPLAAELTELLEPGRTHGGPQTRRFCANLQALRPALFCFARVPGVEPTNNRAERDLRPAVLWRKGSCGTQSAAGSRFVERMLTVRTSCRERGVPLLLYLTEVCRAQDAGRPIPGSWPGRPRDGPRRPRPGRRRRRRSCRNSRPEG